jgi:hypothetical protein
LPAAGLTCHCVFIVCLRKEEASERVHAAFAIWRDCLQEEGLGR